MLPLLQQRAVDRLAAAPEGLSLRELFGADLHVQRTGCEEALVRLEADGVATVEGERVRLLRLPMSEPPTTPTADAPQPPQGRRRKGRPRALPDASRQRLGAHNRTKTHCRRGHPYDEANTYVYAKTGQRMCRACAALTASARNRTHYQNRKARRAAAPPQASP